MALVIVIGALALATMLLLAMFSLTETEYRSTQSYVAGLSAKQYSETAVSLVEAQLQNGQNTETLARRRTFHATQPGMVRVYEADGSFLRALKLYSAAHMAVPAPELNIYRQDEFAPSSWATMPSRYVDLNEPAVRPSLSAGGVSVYFPVIDPRAYWNYAPGGTHYTRTSPPGKGDKTTQVEGFSYDAETPGIGPASPIIYGTTKAPDDVTDPNLLRLPMPVEWIYFLQDGTMGTLDNGNRFVSAGGLGSMPNAANPMVARVAFWTDDESCKININTAAEGTFMSSPYYYHDRDRRWANFPAMASEYQRYPGHPATVALSAVLAPNFRLDPVRPNDDGYSAADYQSIRDIKEAIYALAPKIAQKGSYSGTVPFISDEFSIFNGEGTTTSAAVDSAVARAERLYASVDEMLFADGKYGNNGREAAEFIIPGSGGQVLFDHDTLERSRFFLTAHSRSPEFSIYGLPRICMWPIADELGRIGGPQPERLRTNFDNMIALCATLRGDKSGPAIENSYIFRRTEPHHSTHDVTGAAAGYRSSQGLARNRRLLDYLVKQMSDLQWPETGSTQNAPDFGAKYGADNVRQLAVEFFDYIRSTNLYDGILARGNDGWTANGLSGTNLYLKRDQLAPLRYTYTDQRVTLPATNINANANNIQVRAAADDAGVLPGHGQVTPAVYLDGGKSYMGFGRMFTLSEVGLHIICTADGKNDEYAVDFEGIKSGGGTAFRAIPNFDVGNPPKPEYMKNSAIYSQYNVPQDRNAVWWSNFPPLKPGAEEFMTEKYGSKNAPAQGPYHPSRHPGYDPLNWNLTLTQNTPLEEGEKRIQAIFLMETFCPMLGWTKIHPEYAIVLDGNYIAQIKINNHPIFDTTGDIVVKSNGNVYEFTNQHSCGGHAAPSAVSGNRGGRAVSNQVGPGLPQGGAAVGQVAVTMPSDSSWVSGNTDGHLALNNYGLVGDFLTVPRDQPMKLTFPKDQQLLIRLYDKHDYKNNLPIQRIAISFDDSTIPTPRLVYNNYPKTEPIETSEGKGGLQGSELNYHTRVDQFGNIKYRRSTQGPHYWCFNNGGCLGRLRGRVNPKWTGSGNEEFWLTQPAPYPPGAGEDFDRQSLRGRLDNVAAAAWSPPGTADGISIIPPETIPGGGAFESDVIRTMVPAAGDYRMIAARYDVPATMWRRHPLWTEDEEGKKQYSIHTFSGQWGNNEPGFDLPQGKDRRLLVADVNFGNPTTLTDFSRTPDLPPDDGIAHAANAFGDFDTGISNAREGAYINKPDEGNFYAGTFTRNNVTKFYRSGYFYESWRNTDDWRSGVFMTPNRLISSPVMFGSLPTGIWPVGGNQMLTSTTGTNYASLPCRPWQTLLFRPYVQSNIPAYGSQQNHPGEAGPRDHFLLDMFFMPVVEPYAISEPLSVAGRINMNYQIMPFTHIRRATGMHAVMKGEFITAIPDGDAFYAKGFKSSPSTPQVWDIYFDERTSPQKYWHRPINVDETLVQFDERFAHMTSGAGASGLFLSASQICEMHLIPDVSSGVSVMSGENLPPLVHLSRTQRKNAMQAFWQNHRVTGENVRERPYSNLYSRLTTRSNTFRVHVRSQVIKKARSTDPAVFDVNHDSVLSEYRGSSLIERFIDPTDTDNPLPDYGTSGNPIGEEPLDTFYQYRVIENKRFNP